MVTSLEVMALKWNPCSRQVCWSAVRSLSIVSAGKLKRKNTLSPWNVIQVLCENLWKKQLHGSEVLVQNHRYASFSCHTTYALVRKTSWEGWNVLVATYTAGEARRCCIKHLIMSEQTQPKQSDFSSKFYFFIATDLYIYIDRYSLTSRQGILFLSLPTWLKMTRGLVKK